MQEKGYQVNSHTLNNWDFVYRRFAMPSQLRSCHTAIIDGYLIEGHVPESDIKKLLEQRPTNIAGISAPGMPQHSPGMARPGQKYKDFNVVAFDKNGNIGLYNRY